MIVLFAPMPEKSMDDGLIWAAFIEVIAWRRLPAPLSALFVTKYV